MRAKMDIGRFRSFIGIGDTGELLDFTISRPRVEPFGVARLTYFQGRVDEYLDIR